MDYHNIIKHSPKLLQKWEFNTFELYHNFLYIPRETLKTILHQGQRKQSQSEDAAH